MSAMAATKLNLPSWPVFAPDEIAAVTRVWREAIDCAASAARWSVQPAWTAELGRWAEGQQHTLGAYDRPWR